jgi:hypothetical protein
MPEKCKRPYPKGYGLSLSFLIAPGVEDPMNDREHESEEKRPPESSDYKARHDKSSEHYEKCIYDEGEEAERKNVYRQRKDDKNRFDKEIQRTKNNGGDYRSRQGHVDTRHEVGRDANSYRRNDPM